MPETLPALTAFTPVPRQKQRSNGWKADVQRAFIEKLADTGSVKAAAKAVGRSPESAYALRRHPEAAEFAAAWEEALDFGIKRIEDTAMDHALNGVEVPVYSYGKLVGKRTVYNDRLLMFMLRNRAPDRFCDGGAKGLNAIGKKQIAKLRQEWEREWMAKDLEEQEKSFENINAFLDNMQRNHRANISPARRAHEIAGRAQQKADSAAGWRPGMPYGPYAEKAAELLPQFIAEIEATWPPLPEWAWEAPEGRTTPFGNGPIPSPTDPVWQEMEGKPDDTDDEDGPRIRTLKDSSW